MTKSRTYVLLDMRLKKAECLYKFYFYVVIRTIRDADMQHHVQRQHHSVQDDPEPSLRAGSVVTIRRQFLLLPATRYYGVLESHSSAIAVWLQLPGQKENGFNRHQQSQPAYRWKRQQHRHRQSPECVRKIRKKVQWNHGRRPVWCRLDNILMENPK